LASLLADWRGHGPGYKDLADAIRMLVVDARIPDGTRLPSERTLAEALDVSRTTTTRAYEELRGRGLLASRQGSGTVVTVPLSDSSTSAMLHSPDSLRGIMFTHAASPGVPGLGTAFERAIDRLPALLATTGYLPDGYEPLREFVAARYTERGLPTDPSQIVITSGAQGALAIVAATLVSRGDRVLVEACGFPHLFDTLGAGGGRMQPMPYGAVPWNIDDVRDAAPAAEIAFLTPDFHNPTGAVMDERQRADVARTLQRAGVLTVIDETLRDMNLDGHPLPPSYATFDADAVTIGSLSKSVWGGLRIGWIRSPHHLVSGFVQTRVRLDMGSSAFDQVVALEALVAGIDGAHLPRLRAQRDVLIDALRATLPEFEMTSPEGGMSLWVTLPRRASSRLVAAAQAQQLHLLPGSRFFASRGAAGDQFIRMPFAQPPEVLVDAVDRLARAWETVEHGAPMARSTELREIDLIA
jgi:DNA-binding transcriptional MocR family regulator